MDTQQILDYLQAFATDPEKQAQAITTLATLAGLWVSKWVAWAGWRVVTATTGFAWHRVAQPITVKALWGTLHLIDRPELPKQSVGVTPHSLARPPLDGGLARGHSPHRNTFPVATSQTQE